MDDAATAVRKWAWTQDDTMLGALLEMPASPEVADLVARTCLARCGNDRCPKLLLKYAPFMNGHVLDDMHECVRDGLLFAPAKHWCQIAAELPHDQLTTKTIIHMVGHGSCSDEVTYAAAHALATGLSAHPADLAEVLPQLCNLAPTSADATFLIGQIARQSAGLITERMAKRAIASLVQRNACGSAYAALFSLARAFPKHVAQGGGLRVALMLGNTIKIVEDTCVAEPQSENELLVYLRVHGVIPDCAKNWMLSAMRNPCPQYRGVYADQLMDCCQSTIPGQHPFDEQLHGVVTFLPSGVQILRAPLARVSDFFQSSLLCNDTTHVDADKDVLVQFRNVVYYDTAPSPLLATAVAKMADMFCAPRCAYVAVEVLAKRNFWTAFDTAKDWPYLRPLLRKHAMQQAHQLARGSRGPEIAALLAGVSC